PSRCWASRFRPGRCLLSEVGAEGAGKTALDAGSVGETAGTARPEKLRAADDGDCGPAVPAADETDQDRRSAGGRPAHSVTRMNLNRPGRTPARGPNRPPPGRRIRSRSPARRLRTADP